MVGLPVIEILLEAQLAITPSGKPTGVPIPVAPLVKCDISVSSESTHSVGEEDAIPAVLMLAMVIVPVAVTLLQPPVNGMA